LILGAFPQGKPTKWNKNLHDPNLVQETYISTFATYSYNLAYFNALLRAFIDLGE
jgi:hypothetical protein